MDGPLEDMLGNMDLRTRHRKRRSRIRHVEAKRQSRHRLYRYTGYSARVPFLSLLSAAVMVAFSKRHQEQRKVN